MSDTSFAVVSRRKKLVDIADDEWLNDFLSDDGKFFYFNYSSVLFDLLNCI